MWDSGEKAPNHFQRSTRRPCTSGVNSAGFSTRNAITTFRGPSHPGWLVANELLMGWAAWSDAAQRTSALISVFRMAVFQLKKGLIVRYRGGSESQPRGMESE